MNDYFEESQYQRRAMPWLLVAAIWGLTLSHVYQHGITHHNGLLTVAMLLPALAITLLLYRLKLSIYIDRNGLSYKMSPFHRKYSHIDFHDIMHTSLRAYNRGKTFRGWGWGISLGSNYKSYTIDGFSGIEIMLKNGKKIFFGSARAKEMQALLRKFTNQW